MNVGNVGVGGDNPIRVQSMITCDTMDTEASIQQTMELADAGCEIVRITAPTVKDARNLEDIAKGLRERGCDVPIVPGVMPVTNVAQIERFAVLTGMDFPADLADRLHVVAEDADEVRRIGVEVATELCDRLLAEGAPGLHLITLNRSTSTREVWRNLRVGALPAASR